MVKRIDPDLVAEVIRLRTEEKLFPAQIARRISGMTYDQVVSLLGRRGLSLTAKEKASAAYRTHLGEAAERAALKRCLDKTGAPPLAQQARELLAKGYSSIGILSQAMTVTREHAREIRRRAQKRDSRTRQRRAS
jgi:hypothetical protein